jgi:iron complex outermembrane receptor protein
MMSLPLVAFSWPAIAHEVPATSESKDASGSEKDIIVTAVNDGAATKTGVPLLKTPQNIQILSASLLRDQNVSLLEDALKNVAGVQPSGIASGFDFFRIRGFDASDFTFIDGLQRETNANIEPSAFEAIEVLKGPSSSLYGQGSVGGLINLRSRMPVKDTFANLEFGIGSFSYYKPTIDIGGSFDKDRTVYGRLFATYRREGSFVDRVKGVERFYVAPSLTVELGAYTKLTLLAQYQREDNMDVAGLPAQGTVLPNINGRIPYRRYIGSRLFPSRVKNSYASVGYLLRHQLSDTVELYQNVRAARYRPRWANLYNGSSLDENQRDFSLFVFDFRRNLRKISTDQGINATISTGSVEHHLTFGVEYSGNSDHQTYYLNYNDLPVLDLFNPDFALHKPELSPSPTRTKSSALGLYFQDVVRLTDRLTLTAGGRWSRIRSNSGDGATSQSKFTPRVGATYELIEGVAAYASWSRSFNPQPGYFTDAGVPVLPEQGEQYELGVKTALFGGRINSTFAVYQLARDNLATTDPQDPSSYIVTGRQRSRGFEIDSQLRLGGGWEALLAYAYTDAKVLADNMAPAGDWTANVPRHSANAYAKYTIPSGLFRGLGFSGGVTGYTKQAADLPNSFFLPGYVVVGGNISYVWDGWRLQLNLDNIFDRKYFPTSYDQTLIMRGDPRSVRLTFGRSF